MATHEDHHCIVKGCTNVARYGWAPNRQTPYRWACADHRLQLTRAAPAGEAKPEASPKPGHRPAPDLFERER